MNTYRRKRLVDHFLHLRFASLLQFLLQALVEHALEALHDHINNIFALGVPRVGNLGVVVRDDKVVHVLHKDLGLFQINLDLNETVGFRLAHLQE